MSDPRPAGAAGEAPAPSPDGAPGTTAHEDDRGTSSRSRVVGTTLLLCVGLGVVVGVLWWALAPRGDVVSRDGLLLPVADPELFAARDAVLAALGAAAGVGVGLWVAVRTLLEPVVEPTARAVAAVAGGVLGSATAWATGRVLGPGGAVGSEPVPAPLDVEALGVLGVWPTATALAGFAALLVATVLVPRRRPPAG